MPRRGDNIRKRKDGRWEARYVREDYAEDARKYGSVYGRTYQEAKEKRDLIISKGQDQKSSNNNTILFRDILVAWQATNRIRLKEASISRYQNLIDAHILPELGNKRMSQITVPLLNRYLSAKLESGRLDHTGGLSASYVRSIALVISSAISFGVTENMCGPLQSKMTKPSIPKKELTVLGVEKQETLENELLQNMREEKLLIFITLYTGLRIGEICALRWEDIDLESKLLYVRQTVSRVWISEDDKKKSKLIIGSPKSESSLRCIPICSKLYTILCSFPYRKKHGYILMNAEDNSFISPRTFEYRYKAILKRCSLEPVNYHALRHTFATRCIERGVDIKSLSEILGHSDVSITLNTYVHSSIELKRRQMEKLAS